MKKSILLVLFAFAMLFTGCNPYRKISYKKVDFYKKKKVVEKMDDYDLYIQQGEDTYEFDVTEREGDVLKGHLKKVSTTDAANNQGPRKSVSKEQRNDMIVRLEDDVDLTSNQVTDEVTISPELVNEVAVYAKEDQGVIGAIGTALLIVVGAILALTLILVFAIASAAEDGSGSDSNSGGSDSDSGGSSCFIATMAYGSYEAKQVLILRKFRDQFLQKFVLGRRFINWYYSNSPTFVQQHKGKKWLNKALRVYLNGLVWVLKPFFR